MSDNTTYTNIKANLAYLEYQEKSTDGGVTWERTGKKRAGQIISTDSCECSTTYDWRVTDGYICDGDAKYAKLSFQVKFGCDDWKDVEPVMTKKGNLISLNSIDCKELEPMPVEPEIRKMESTYCDGDNLVKKTWDEILIDPQNGVWTKISGSENIVILETDSSRCIQPQYKTTNSETYCEGMAKYKDVINWVSYDKGITWIETGRTKTLVSSYSTDCAVSTIWKNEGTSYCDGENLIQTQRRYYVDSDGKEYKDSSSNGVRTVIVESSSFRCKDYGCAEGIIIDIINGWEEGGQYEGSNNVCAFQTTSNRQSIGNYKMRIYFNEIGSYRIYYRLYSLAYIGGGDPPNTIYFGRLDVALTESNLSQAQASAKNTIQASYIDYNITNNKEHFVDIWFKKQSVDSSTSTLTDGKAHIAIQKN